MQKSKVFYFLDGSNYPVPFDTCRGCFMKENKLSLPPHITPVYEDEAVIVQQDAEWPIPAFYIISIKEHIGSIMDIDDEVVKRIAIILKRVREGLRVCFGVERAQVYHEEKIINPHFHVWVLPLWPGIMREHNIQPKIYEANIKKYIDFFSFENEKDKILKCNIKMRDFLSKFQ